MNEPRLHGYFHNFMIYFAMWAYAALAVFYGLRHITSTLENGSSCMALNIIVGALLVAVGLFAIWVRFDLAAFRARAIRELLWVCLAAAAIFLALHWVEDLSAEDCYNQCIFKAVIFTCWGIALYRYYGARKHLFK